ncbi:hypothetical protein CCACVL1_15441 [Corchorus capsularis]|uniref:Uncharacterized protein n=1 Tax=Corchorus capsularis TaxID=210143 RepID=A0A1R3I2F2_COCAP|nr:hypothetical protein CCACVL1_15441 [Corchorus capsularis]
MAAPVAVGTRGTVGSLVKKEIDYFTKFELEGRRGSSWKPPQGPIVVEMMDCTSGHSLSRPSFWLSISGWKRKKRRSGTGFLPSMCSATEVAENQLNRIPGFSYRILKHDVNDFHV